MMKPQSGLIGNFSDQITIKMSDWLRKAPRASFNSWRAETCKREMELSAMGKGEVHRYRLMEKYARIWRVHTKKGDHFDVRRCKGIWACNFVCYIVPSVS